MKIKDLISLKTAKLARRKGFDVPVQNRYRKDGGLNQDLELRYGQPINYNDSCFQDEYRKYCSAPTQSELQSWLREKHNIDVEVHRHGAVETIREGFTVRVYSPLKTTFNWDLGGVHKSYEEALEEGLQEALNYFDYESRRVL